MRYILEILKHYSAMILAALLTLMATMIHSASSYYYCPKLMVYNDTPIGQANHSLYIHGSFPLLLNSSVPVEEKNSRLLCLNRTNLETEYTAILGCLDPLSGRQSSHELIEVLGYYMVLVTNHKFFSEKYTWWLNDTEIKVIVADSVLEKLSIESRWKISTQRQRHTTLVHQFEVHAKDAAINFDDDPKHIVTAWLKNGIAYRCHIFNISFQDFLFFTANSSYLSVTLSSEFKFFGNYSIQVTYTNNEFSNFNLELVQDVEDPPYVSSNHKVGASVVIAVIAPVLVLVAFGLLLFVLYHKGRLRCRDRQKVPVYEPPESLEPPERNPTARETKDQEPTQTPRERNKGRNGERECDGPPSSLSPRQQSLSMRSKLFEPTRPSKANHTATNGDKTGEDLKAKEQRFNDLLVEISESVDTDAFNTMKHLLRIDIPKQRRDSFKYPFELFEEMQNRHLLSAEDSGYLENVLYKCGRNDLQKKLSTF